VGRRFGGASRAGSDYPLARPILPDLDVVALVPEKWNLVLQLANRCCFGPVLHTVWVDLARLTGGGENVRTAAVWT
jgi:hypothetical protein